MATGDKVYLIVMINCHNTAGDNIYKLIGNVRLLNFYFSSIQGVSKILIVNFVDKHFKNYKELFKHCPYMRYHLYNIDILEILRFHCNVVKFDFFKSTLKIRRYSSKKVKFFTDPMKDLHGLKLYMRPFIYQPTSTTAATLGKSSW